MSTKTDTSFDKVYAVVLAGGSGSRLWPKSRTLKPKQLCKIGGSDKTLLEATLLRLEGRVPKERRIVITNHAQAELTKKIAGDLCGKVISEPCARNTAAALALGASYIRQLHGFDPDSIMLSWHADHLSSADKSFWGSHRNAVASAAAGNLTLLGITPRSAHTGFGYIEKGEVMDGLSACSVKSFREKPDQNTAETYLKNGGYLWNSGIFVWKVSTFWGELQAHLPATAAALDSFEGFEAKFDGLENISIDHAILEKSKKTSVVDAPIEWQDIGSFDSYRDVFKKDADGNVLFGEVFVQNSQNNVIDVDRYTAIIGLEGITVVSSDNALLVCKTEDAQKVKSVVEQLKKAGRDGLY